MTRSQDFRLTEIEAAQAAARIALRQELGDRWFAQHLAPLVAFVLALAFAAILGLTGLMPRRAAEIALLLSIIVFMLQRTYLRFRMRSVRKTAAARFESGDATAEFDEDGFAISGAGAGAGRRWRYAECHEAEVVNEILYLWPRKGDPAVAPLRAFPESSARESLFSALASATTFRRPAGASKS